MDSKSFWAGYMMGDNAPGEATLGLGKKQKKKTNIALQDTIWCQVLSNMIADLEEFVKNTSPTPEEFIRRIIPSHPSKAFDNQAFASVNINERNVKDYVKWIDALQKSQTLIDDKDEFTSDYKKLSAVRKIWQTPALTPEFDELELLFPFTCMRNDTFENNGRIYEGGENAFGLPSGLPKGFFTQSVAAKIIADICSCTTKFILEKYGFTYTQTRFAIGEKQKQTPQEVADARYSAYNFLRAKETDLCHTNWCAASRLYGVDYTKTMAEQDKTLSQENKEAEAKDVKRIYEALGDEAAKYTALNLAGGGKRLIVSCSLIFAPLLIIAVFVILMIAMPNSEWVKACLLVSPILWVICVVADTAIFGGSYERFARNVTSLRRAYYANDGSVAAQEYSRILKYIKRHEEDK